MLYHLLHELLEGRHYAYENTLFRGACAALLCFVLVLVLSPRMIRQLTAWKVGDRPEFDHARLNALMRNKSNVPTMGGLLILGSIALSVLLLCDLTNFYVQMSIVCLFWLGALGAVDDWLKLTARRRALAARARGRAGGDRETPARPDSRDGLKTYEKLLFQIGLGVVIGFYIYNHGRGNFAVDMAALDPLGESAALPAYKTLSVPFYKAGIQLSAMAFMVVTVLVMTGTSNAVNLTDGMDGLAAGCVALCSAVFAVLTHIVGTESLSQKLLFLHVPLSGELVVLCGAIFGSCLGFLWY
ncbi:MAG: hypothetical protein IIB60_06850, partial [Planctomycetes bacterium]|nr:hypothetical protein [Planctomycetota bacterium]